MSLLLGLDRRLLRAMRTRCHGRRVERTVRCYSRLGEHGAVWLAIGMVGALAAGPRRPTYRRLVRTVAVADLANWVLKLAIGRPRPELRGLPALMSTHSTLSCPSAHATTSFAAARVLSPGLPSGPVYVAAATMACSRPYLGVHYPSDAIAGMLLGRILADFVP
jgi:membrane-associated phospholipid phosphatase